MRAHHLHLSRVQLDRYVRRYGELDLSPRIRVRLSIHQLGLRWEQRVHGPSAGLRHHGHGCPPFKLPTESVPNRDSVKSGCLWSESLGCCWAPVLRSCVWRLCALPALRIPSHCQIVCVRAGPPPTARTDLCCVMRLREWRGGDTWLELWDAPRLCVFFSAVQKCPRKAHGTGLETRLL